MKACLEAKVISLLPEALANKICRQSLGDTVEDPGWSWGVSVTLAGAMGNNGAIELKVQKYKCQRHVFDEKDIETVGNCTLSRASSILVRLCSIAKHDRPED